MALLVLNQFGQKRPQLFRQFALQSDIFTGPRMPQLQFRCMQKIPLQ
jgi:hypothetical protein